MNKENKCLFLFTESFPFGHIEQFLETEIEYLAGYFDGIKIIPFRADDRITRRDIPENAETVPPLFDSSRLKLILKGLFNLSPVGFALRELFKKKAFCRFRWLRSWLEASLQVRYLLRPRILNKILNHDLLEHIRYFYWADNAAKMIPFVKKERIAPTAVRFHGSDLYEELKGGYIPYRDHLLKTMTHGLCISEYGLDYLRKRYPSIPFQAGVFRLGVRTRGLSKPSSDGIFRIMSCSALIPIKRIHLIIEALNLLDIRVEWTHIGSGPLEQQVKSQADLLPDNIVSRFTGRMNNQDVMRLYQEQPVDLFINVSQSEGVPVTIMEAFSAGIPVLATDVGGVKEIVDDSVGKLLHKDVSPAALAVEIKRYFEFDGQSKKQFRVKAYQRWEVKCQADQEYHKLGQFLVGLTEKK